REDGITARTVVEDKRPISRAVSVHYTCERVIRCSRLPSDLKRTVYRDGGRGKLAIGKLDVARFHSTGNADPPELPSYVANGPRIVQLKAECAGVEIIRLTITCVVLYV